MTGLVASCIERWQELQAQRQEQQLDLLPCNVLAFRLACHPD